MSGVNIWIGRETKPTALKQDCLYCGKPLVKGKTQEYLKAVGFRCSNSRWFCKGHLVPYVKAHLKLNDWVKEL